MLRGSVLVDPVVGGGGGPYWLLQVQAPANQIVRVLDWRMTQITSPAMVPGLLQIYRATTPGTGGTVLVPAALDEDEGESFASVWRTGLTIAPTGLSEIFEEMVRESTGPGARVRTIDPLTEPQISVKGGGVLAWAFTPDPTVSSATVKIAVKFGE